MDVEKLKLDGAFWRWQAREVATDVHGTWLYSPAGTVCQGRDGAEYIQPANGVQLMPDHQCWAAWWWQGRDLITIDIATMTEKVDQTWRFTDHELDLWCTDNDCGVVDRDELDEAVQANLIDKITAHRAEQVADELHVRLRSHDDDLFAKAGWEMLRRAGSPPVPSIDAG